MPKSPPLPLMLRAPDHFQPCLFHTSNEHQTVANPFSTVHILFSLRVVHILLFYVIVFIVALCVKFNYYSSTIQLFHDFFFKNVLCIPLYFRYNMKKSTFIILLGHSIVAWFLLMLFDDIFFILFYKIIGLILILTCCLVY